MRIVDPDPTLVEAELRAGCANSPGAQKTHVLLPKVALLRRADTVHTIVEALVARHLEKYPRRGVVARAGAPPDTVRGWQRR